jgi:hypothetical protein
LKNQGFAKYLLLGSAEKSKAVFENIIAKLVEAMLGGGPQAFVAILAVIIALLLWERRRLLGDISKKDEKIEKIIDDYYKGNLSLSEALTHLKLVLYEIKGRIE